MAMDPEELVTLTDHGTMRLRSAVVRAMILSAKERKRATIVREGKPAILHFQGDQGPRGKVGRTAWIECAGESFSGTTTTAKTHSISWDWAEKPLDSPLTIDTAIHEKR